MSSSQRKKPSSPPSGSSRTKRKPTKSASKTKALVTKAEHVRRQKLNSDKASGTKKKSSNDGVGETLEVLAPALAVPRAWAFWSPMAVLLRQQTLLASLTLNVIQSQRLWAQAFSRAS
jgi:hypothetical protein